MVGDHVEPQIESIIRRLAELENELSGPELQVGELRAKQNVLKDELSRVCVILRTTADPVERRCDYGWIKYGDTGLSVTLKPEVAALHRGEY